jgi:hypothetical protein
LRNQTIELLTLLIQRAVSSYSKEKESLETANAEQLLAMLMYIVLSTPDISFNPALLPPLFKFLEVGAFSLQIRVG